jgi:hypothetical protein
MLYKPVTTTVCLRGVQGGERESIQWLKWRLNVWDGCLLVVRVWFIDAIPGAMAKHENVERVIDLYIKNE